MNYAAELKKFVTGQYIYSGFRIALSIVIPCLILAHFGLLKTYFLFPLGTSFLGLTDMSGPFIRRRNALLFAIFCFFFVSITAGFLKDYPFFIFLEILIFGIFFTMLGVYGQRLAAVGSLTLVVFAIFVDGASRHHSYLVSSLIFIAGALWFFIIFLVVTKLQPYKLAQKMIGENYIELGNYLKLKAKFYLKNPDIEAVFRELFRSQVKIKDLQESTREIVFKTRKIVNEATSTSRIMMMLFLNSIDLFEKLLTSQNDYRKLQDYFGNTPILQKINYFLNELSDELVNIGIAIQGGTKAKPTMNIAKRLDELHQEYYELRNHKLSSETLEKLMVLRQILYRISEIANEIIRIYKVETQNPTLARSLSTGLDLEKFVTRDEKLNIQVMLQNFTLSSNYFRHAIRVTLALLIGYFVSKLPFLHIHKTFWILITILAIMRPAYSITKHRNILRLYGTIGGAIVGFLVILYITNPTIQFVIFMISMILTFSFLKEKYAWAVFFMTIYIFLTFNFLNPGNFNVIFYERLKDTIIAGIIVFLVSYFVLPIWEHTKNKDLMLNFVDKNTDYFNTILMNFQQEKTAVHDYKIKRKNAIVSLANLSDNFQKMLSDPKNKQKNLENIHQFVTTSHLFTAYSASLSVYAQQEKKYPEIDFTNWQQKIDAELSQTKNLLKNKIDIDENSASSQINPDDLVNEMLQKRKKEIAENEFFDHRDPKKISHLTELKNIQELLELIYGVTIDQRKIALRLED